jgi:hypothetical protein
VGKAQATALWTGARPLVHVTVASANGEPLAAGSALHVNLVAAFASLRDTTVPVRLQGFARLHFKLSAQVRFDTRYRREAVEQHIRTTLGETFSFARRAFGQAVTQAEVTTAIQSVPGVLAVNLTRFARADAAADAAPAALLAAERARWNAALASTRPAQLLLLYPGADAVMLQEMPA